MCNKLLLNERGPRLLWLSKVVFEATYRTWCRIRYLIFLYLAKLIIGR